MTRWRGHDREIAELIAAQTSGRLHHGWIFAGPQGVGKAGIARDFAKRLLVSGAGGAVPADVLTPRADDPAVTLFDAGAHPDFMSLERLERDDRKGESSGLARNISIAQVRGLSRLLNSAPSMGTRRVILIDSADDLETGAANALLKSLEEPPAGAIFLLIAHTPGRLLPTIRSRCRMLRFQPLDDGAMAQVLAEAVPDLPAEERAALGRVALGSPGQALASRALALPDLEQALERIAAGDRRTESERARLVQALSPIAARPRLEAFVEMVPRFIAARTRDARGRALGSGLAAYEEAQRLGAGAVTPLQLEPGALVHMLCDIVAGLAHGANRSERV